MNQQRKANMHFERDDKMADISTNWGNRRDLSVDTFGLE